MPKSANQKLKLIYIKDILEQYTDENHNVSVEFIISKLDNMGIKSERKSIYNDIESLRQYGMDIILQKSRPSGYYLASREFELPELKLLVDLIQSSKFLTKLKSGELIKKMESLCSCYQASQLSRQIIVANRIKNMNESIYYNVDAIQSAISENRKIKFKYFIYDEKKQRVFKKDGGFYTVSPYALVSDNENYYLVAYDDESRIIKHYRVDRIMNVETTNDERDGKAHFDKMDIGKYSSKMFSMFGGAEENVKLRFENSLASVVIDRFGNDIIMMKHDDNHFDIRADIAISPQFYAWIFSFCGAAEILSPQSVIDGMREHIKAVSDSMREGN